MEYIGDLRMAFVNRDHGERARTKGISRPQAIPPMRGDSLGQNEKISNRVARVGGASAKQCSRGFQNVKKNMVVTKKGAEQLDREKRQRKRERGVDGEGKNAPPKRKRISAGGVPLCPG